MENGTVRTTILLMPYCFHHPFLSQSSVKPGPITSLQFSLAGFGDLCHISGQCRRRSQAKWSCHCAVDILASVLPQSRPWCACSSFGGRKTSVSSSSLQWSLLSRLDPGVEYTAVVVAFPASSWRWVHCGGLRIPGLILALLSQRVVPVDGSQHQTSLTFFSTSLRVVNWVKVDWLPVVSRT